MPNPTTSSRPEPGNNPVATDKKSGDIAVGDKGKQEKNERNTKPERVDSKSRNHEKSEKSRADRQRAEQDRKVRETQQRVKDAGASAKGHAQRRENTSGMQEKQKQTNRKHAKESGEAAQQKSDSKRAGHQPEKAATSSNLPNKAGKQNGRSITKKQQELENLAKNPETHPELVRSRIGGSRPRVSPPSRKPDGTTSIRVTHQSGDGEVTMVEVTRDLAGNAETMGVTIHTDGSYSGWASVESRGRKVSEIQIDKGRGTYGRSQLGGIENTRLYTGQETDHGGVTKENQVRRPERAPQTSPPHQSPTQPRPNASDDKAPRPRPEHRHSPDAVSSDAADSSKRYFGKVPVDYVERPQDYEAQATFERVSGVEGGTLYVERGMLSVTALVHSGITKVDTPLGSIPIPLMNAAPEGTYDLLSGGESRSDRPVDKFRLEKHDFIYGNDEADGLFYASGWFGYKDLNQLRLHGPGQSLGCVTVGRENGDRSDEAHQAWTQVQRIVGMAPVGKRTVWKYDRFTNSTILGFFRREEVDYFGTLTIRDKRSKKVEPDDE